MNIKSALFVFAITLAAVPAWAGTKYQANLVPAPADCFVGDFSCLNVDGVCGGGGNVECALGTVAKASVKLDGKLGLKAKFSGVTDVAGALLTTGPAETDTNNLLLKLSLSKCVVDNGVPACSVQDTDVYLKVVLTNGKGSVSLNLAASLGLTSGSPLAVLGVELTGPNASCPGDNTPASVTARVNDLLGQCGSAVVRATSGVVVD